MPVINKLACLAICTALLSLPAVVPAQAGVFAAAGAGNKANIATPMAEPVHHSKRYKRNKAKRLKRSRRRGFRRGFRTRGYYRGFMYPGYYRGYTFRRHFFRHQYEFGNPYFYPYVSRRSWGRGLRY